MGFIKEAFSTVPNLISISRLILIVPLWIWTWQGRFEWVGYGLFYAVVSDVLDGMIARVFDQCSEIGERLDSWADHLILISAVIWLFFFLGDVFPPGRRLWMIPAIIIFLIAFLIGMIKNRQFGGNHILEGKPLALFGYLGVILALFGIYSEVIYICLIVSWIVHSTVNIIHNFRPDLFNKHQRSLILGLLGIDFEEGPIRYFFS